MRIVCISDTHGMLNRIVVPDGDVLIHAGDATNRGTHQQVYEFARDMSRLPHKVKIFVAGNHDFGFQDHREQFQNLVESAGVTYLQDSYVIVDGFKVYGSPWQPEFRSWAFNLPRGKPLADVWARIPSDTEVLVTHSPPDSVMDMAPGDVHVGCADLAVAVSEIKPRLHVFGHIHECYGTKVIGETMFVNAASCNGGYEPVNTPIVIDL